MCFRSSLVVYKNAQIFAETSSAVRFAQHAALVAIGMVGDLEGDDQALPVIVHIPNRTEDVYLVRPGIPT